MITIVTAFAGEARPLIAALGLSRRTTRETCTLYSGGRRRLLITGPGKARVAHAIAALQATEPAIRDGGAWLNIGIAGHPSLEIGTGALAHRITDRETGKSRFPPQVHGLALATENLVTVDRPEPDYPEPALYDMEASGFHAAACRGTTAELVQCYKVVSDNREHALAQVTPRHGETLIADRLDEIDALVTTLETLADRRRGRSIPEQQLGRFTRHWHFTVTQRHQLGRLLARWNALLPEQPVWCAELERLAGSRQVLGWIEQRLDDVPVRLG